MMAEELVWNMPLNTVIEQEEADAIQALIGKARYLDIIDYRTRDITPEQAVEIVKNMRK